MKQVKLATVQHVQTWVYSMTTGTPIIMCGRQTNVGRLGSKLSDQTGVVNWIGREDGSGHRFIVKLDNGSEWFVDTERL